MKPPFLSRTILTLVLASVPFSGLVVRADAVFGDGSRTQTVLLVRGKAPYSFVNEQGQPEGWIVDLWKTWGRHTGVALRFVPVLPESGFEALRQSPGTVLSGFPSLSAPVKGVRFICPVDPGSDGLFIPRNQPVPSMAYYAAAVRDGESSLADLVQKGMESIRDAERDMIVQRWLPGSLGRFPSPNRVGEEPIPYYAEDAPPESTALTQAESDWIDQHPVIRLGFNMDRPPFAYLSKDNDLRGIVSDYEFHLSRFIGFPFSIQERLTDDLLELARSGKLDVIATVEQTPDLGAYFLFTRPYVVTPLVVVMRPDAQYVDNLASLKGRRFVNHLNFPGAFRRLQQDYPWMNPQPVPSVEKGLELVQKGDADAYIGAMATVIPALNNINGNLRVVLSTPYTARIGFAVRKDWPILVDILNKALASIPGEERDRIQNAWVAVPRDRFNWRIVYPFAIGIGLAILILILVGATRNRMLMREITLVKRHEREMKQARDSAYAASQAKSMFLANMSHEIRTPLNAIIGFSQVLGRDPGLSRESRDQIETIMRSGEHLLGLINDILEISKIEADRITVHTAPLDLHDLLRDLEAMFRVRTNAKGIRFEVNSDSQVPRRIVSDVGKIRQILINLIGNAVKFTEAGQILVRVSAVSSGVNGILRCEVEDTGPGISPLDREKIFDSFVQGEGSTGIRGGTGLGLTISRRYAKLLGGEIALVKTELGKGSVFRCELPFEVSHSVPASVQPGRLVTRAIMKDGRAPRVLVVDDEAINRRLLVRVLEMLGFEIKEAANGEDAVARFTAWPPDLVFMDIRMPRMDGLTAARLIREQPHGKDCPVIALTASAFESDKDRILAAGLAGYVRKPFKLDELLAMIKQHISVEYNYAPGTREPPAPAEAAVLEEVAGWPVELRESLCKAAREADVAELDAMLARLPESPAAKAVRRLLDTYDYTALIAVLATPASGARK